jgi:hypothetical protein
MSKDPKPGDKVTDSKGNTHVVQSDGTLEPESKGYGGLGSFIGDMVESVGHTVGQMTPGKSK